jgi:hypothetical protein
VRLSFARAGVCALVLIVTALPAPAAAQSTPWAMCAPANPDHATVVQGVPVVERYELTVTGPSGAAPALNLGKPAIVPSCTIGTVSVPNAITADLTTFVAGLPPGTYTATLAAIGQGGQAVSPASAPFSLTVPAPRPQGAPGISRSGAGL